MAGGVLYVVATPIGNLADVSRRALDVLGAVDLIAAEDTRRTRRLLAAHGVEGRMLSYHDHNEERVAPRLLARLESGESLALVTDAGTPGISDPAFHMVRLAIAAGVRVEAIPGPSAVLAALIVSGLPMDRFTFAGFPPRRPGRRRRELEGLAGLPHSLVFFEAPGRLAAFLRAVDEVLGPRPLAICRELTKLHEEVWRGTAREWLEERGERPPRGEVTVVIGGAAADRPRRSANAGNLEG